MRRVWQALAATTGILSIATASLAANVNNRDTEFLQYAAQAGRLEIEASKLAYQHSSTPQVREFAQMMIVEHTATDEALNALAAGKGISLNKELPDDKQKKISLWQGLAPHDVDTRYVEEIAIRAHEDAVGRFKDAVDSASDSDVKAFAEKTLPDLQHHLARAKVLQQEVANTSGRDAAAPANARGGQVTSPAAPDSTGTGGGEPTNEPPPESPNKAANPQ